jgi:hypothetical protein
MAEIVIRLERGPDDQPVGEVRAESGRLASFTGWLALIRILEDEMSELPPHGTGLGEPGAQQRPPP